MWTDPLLNHNMLAVSGDGVLTRVAHHFRMHGGVQDMIFCDTPDQVVVALKECYQRQTQHGKKALFAENQTRTRAYPYLGVYVAKCDFGILQSHGIFGKSGFYGSTITQPGLYEQYLHQQITLLMASHTIVVGVGISSRCIPFSFLPHAAILNLECAEPQIDLRAQTVGDPNIVPDAPSHTAPHTPDYEDKHAPVAPSAEPMPILHTIEPMHGDGTYNWENLPTKPLGLFSAERIDYSLSRLQHYTGTSADQFQNFILFTNYAHYVDAFFQYAKDPARLAQGYTAWSGPLGQWSRLTQELSQDYRVEGRHFQMPAYHLQRSDRQGITLIDIGVGPSNMKTMTDHLAVLRSHCWMMLGHCGGLDHTQRLGDFVIANGYMREDKVLDDVLPLHIPIPPVSDVQQALHHAAGYYFPNPEDLRRSVRSGTVLTTANRNWELDILGFSRLIHQSKSIAIDMESATLAANAFRFSVPYGALLCVSDQPLHGELKMAQSAQSFYQNRVHHHMLMGIHAMECLRNHGVLTLHSRKLRGYQTSPFR